MADHGLRLRPGIYEHLREYLEEPTDRALARRLGVSYETARNAKAASTDPARPAPMLFVSAANRVTNWPLDSLVTNHVNLAQAA